MKKITGFEPSQPSIHFDEQVRELEILIRQKHPEIAEFEDSKRVQDSGSISTKMPNEKSGAIDVATEIGRSKKLPDPSDESANEDSPGVESRLSWIIVGVALLGGFVLLLSILKARKNQLG